MNQSLVDNAATESYNQWRRVKDKIATGSITAGGVSVLFAILLIFFYLLYEVLPMFASADMDKGNRYAVQGEASAAPLYLAMEEQAEQGLRLDSTGVASFFNIEDGSLVSSTALPVSDVTAFALDSEPSRLFALGQENGDVLLAKHQYRTTYPNDVRTITPAIEYPYGEDSLDIASEPIIELALRDTDDELLIIAKAGDEVLAQKWLKEEDFFTEEIVLEEDYITLPSFDIDPSRILIGPTLQWVYLIAENGDYQVLDLLNDRLADSGSLLEAGRSLAETRFLVGGISLMVSDSTGEISQWFMVRQEDGSSTLQKIRSFEAGAEVDSLVTEHRRKGFVSVNQEGELRVFHATAHRQVLSERIEAEQRVRGMAISPRGDVLITEADNGEIQSWTLDNEHPDVSVSSLWGKVWYESYEEPSYTWQSSAADNDFEPKFSLSPLAFGTLKAAFYAMLLAAPLAICGAIYTAYFMAPALRTKVKPLIELMEALPTVILGFLAGLWLAPFIEKNLPAIFSIFLVLPIGILLFAWCWSRLPVEIRKHVPEGWEPALLVPVVILLVMACMTLSQPLEVAFFNGDMRAWITNDLGITFDQRNSLIVGIAMGFAVIPTIFSIAEDAIFSVPKNLSHGSLALGASPWQTLVGVVMPTASPGIFSAMMIGMGRAVGETMIVLMATGNTPVMDMNIFEGMRTLSANIAVEIGETEVDSTHYRVLFLAAFVLFIFTFTVNTVAEVVRQRLRQRYGNL